MKSIPHDLEEAAMIDGCGYFGTLIKVILPMAQPGLIPLGEGMRIDGVKG